MKKIIFFIVIYCNYLYNINAQIAFKPFVQARIIGDLNFKKAGNLMHARLNISAGAKGLINKEVFWSSHDLYIAPIGTVSFLLGKGLGASVKDKRFTLRPQFNVNINLSTEWGKIAQNSLRHNIQGSVQYIDNGFYSAKENVVNISTAIMVVDKKGGKNYLQRIGTLFVGIKRFSMAYYNDAAPFNTFKLADGFDRMFTGGGHISINLAKENQQQQIVNNDIVKPFINETRRELRVTFDRYTGYEKNSYEIGNALFQDAVSYRNIETRAYNRGMFTLGWYSDNYNLALAVHDWDEVDVQNLIHKMRLFPLHQSINSKHSFSFQGSFNKPIYKP